MPCINKHPDTRNYYIAVQINSFQPMMRKDLIFQAFPRMPGGRNFSGELYMDLQKMKSAKLQGSHLFLPESVFLEEKVEEKSFCDARLGINTRSCPNQSDFTGYDYNIFRFLGQQPSGTPAPEPKERSWRLQQLWSRSRSLSLRLQHHRWAEQPGAGCEKLEKQRPVERG